MKVLLAKKQTEEQIKSNEYVKFQFVMAMMNMDERMIGTLLKENGVFFGNKNNWQTLHWFKKQFKGLNNTFFNSRLKEGLSLDVYPGSIMFEFKYSALNTDNFEDDPFSEEYQEALFNSKDAITITLVLLFENAKITDIRIPKRIFELSKLKQLQTEN